jgi:hydroxypyruvate reductase
MAIDSGSRLLLTGFFDQAVAAVSGHSAVRRALRVRGIEGPVTLVAVGKAAQSMTEGACEVLGAQVRGGLVISKPGHLDPEQLARIGLDAVVGGHPVPTEGSLEAGRRLLETLDRAGGETLLFLVSGGASSLVEAPASGVGLLELERLNKWLLGSGLPIDAMNLIRKSVSHIKGGGLLTRLQGHKLRALAISDVPGDDPGIIGSGLLVPEPNLATRLTALNLPAWLQVWTERGLAERAGIPDQGPEVELVATLDIAKQAAATAAADKGLPVHLHTELLEGDAGERGRELARQVMEGPAGVHIWGGETTVRLPARPGRGGRNQHLALAAAVELAGRDDCLLLSGGTDGTDGPTEDAGALVDGGTLERAALEGFDADSSLAAADAGSLLAASGDLIHTGPTGTNVMDLVLGLKLSPRAPAVACSPLPRPAPGVAGDGGPRARCHAGYDRAPPRCRRWGDRRPAGDYSAYRAERPP